MTLPVLHAGLLASRRTLPAEVIVELLDCLPGGPKAVVKTGDDDDPDGEDDDWVVDLMLRPELDPGTARSLYDRFPRQTGRFAYWSRAEHSTTAMLAGLRTEPGQRDDRARSDRSDRSCAALVGDILKERRGISRAAECADSDNGYLLLVVADAALVDRDVRIAAMRRFNDLVGVRQVYPPQPPDGPWPGNRLRDANFELARAGQQVLARAWRDDADLGAAFTLAVPNVPQLLERVVPEVEDAARRRNTPVDGAVLQVIVDALVNLIAVEPGFTATEMLWAVHQPSDAHRPAVVRQLTGAQRAQLHQAASARAARERGRPIEILGQDLATLFAPPADIPAAAAGPLTEVADWLLNEVGSADWPLLLTLGRDFTGTVGQLRAAAAGINQPAEVREPAGASRC
jgi:hypothetical protein